MRMNGTELIEKARGDRTVSGGAGALSVDRRWVLERMVINWGHFLANGVTSHGLVNARIEQKDAIRADG